MKVILCFAAIFLLGGGRALYAAAAADGKLSVGVDSLFAYDKTLPLLAEEKKTAETGAFTRYSVRFFSIRGEFVPGILTLPKGARAPFPAVIFQHGLGGDKEKEPLVRYGTEELAKAGYAVISLDAAEHGERKSALTQGVEATALVKYPYAMRDVFTQTVTDVRRAVDYLQGRGDIDRERIFYMGISMGAIQGVLATALEKRIRGLVTVVGGGNFVECNPLYRAMPGPKDLMVVMDSVNYAARISPRPILMLNGEKDPIVPKACAKALFDAAGEPKTQIFYDTKHEIPREEGMKTVIEWLKKNGG